MRASFTAALSGLCIPLFPPPPPSLAFIYFFALFSLHQFLSLSLPAALVRYPLSSPPCLCMLPSLISFFPRQKYEYFRAKKLKGNNETAPKLNYTPFPEPQKRDFPEWWAHRRHVGVPFTPSHTDKLVVSCFYVRSMIFPLILLTEFRNQPVEE